MCSSGEVILFPFENRANDKITAIRLTSDLDPLRQLHWYAESIIYARDGIAKCEINGFNHVQMDFISNVISTTSTTTTQAHGAPDVSRNAF